LYSWIVQQINRCSTNEIQNIIRTCISSKTVRLNTSRSQKQVRLTSTSCTTIGKIWRIGPLFAVNTAPGGKWRARKRTGGIDNWSHRGGPSFVHLIQFTYKRRARIRHISSRNDASVCFTVVRTCRCSSLPEIASFWTHNVQRLQYPPRRINKREFFGMFAIFALIMLPPLPDYRRLSSSRGNGSIYLTPT